MLSDYQTFKVLEMLYSSDLKTFLSQTVDVGVHNYFTDRKIIPVGETCDSVNDGDNKKSQSHCVYISAASLPSH